MSLAIDTSNYTSPLTPGALREWKDAGVELVIVQAVDPPAGFPAGKTRVQIQQCLDAGLVVDAYVWLWFDLDVTDIERKLFLLEGLPIRRLWLDVEDEAAAKYSQTTVEGKIRDALVACDVWARGHALPVQPTGIYSGNWWWTDRRLGGNTTAFSARALWDSNYDDVPDAAVHFRPYGGWTSCAIKQYRGTSTFGGVGGVDLNVLSDAEAALLHPPTGDDDVLIPDDYVQKFSLPDNRDVQGLIDHFEGVITTVREIALAEGQAEGADAEAKLAKIKEVVNAGSV